MLVGIANREDLDQTEEAVWSGSALFFIARPFWQAIGLRMFRT